MKTELIIILVMSVVIGAIAFICTYKFLDTPGSCNILTQIMLSLSIGMLISAICCMSFASYFYTSSKEETGEKESQCIEVQSEVPDAELKIKIKNGYMCYVDGIQVDGKELSLNDYVYEINDERKEIYFTKD